MSEPAKVEIREAVGVFHTAPEMEAAIEELEEHGFDRAEISLWQARNPCERSSVIVSMMPNPSRTIRKFLAQPSSLQSQLATQRALSLVG
jgi:hypothetical protein